MRARTSTHQQCPRRSASSFQLPPSRARAVDQIVAAVPRIEAIEGSASRFGPNPSSPKAKEELIVAVACQESTRAQGVTLKAERTEAKSAHCRGAPHHARSSVFPCIRPFETRGNNKGSCFFEKRPKQEDTPSSPLSWMELKLSSSSTLDLQSPAW